MEDKQELIQSVLEVPCFPIQERNLGSGYVKFPLSSMAMLGTAFSALPVSIQTVSSSLPAGKQLFEAVIPTNGELVASKGGEGFRSMVRNSETKKFVKGHADFVPVEGAEATTQTLTVDPAQLGMAMSLMAVNMQLSEIRSTQEDIMSFLDIDKQAKLKANLITLSNTARDYQYNYANEQFRQSRDVEILQIRREAEQNIQFYKDYLKDKLSRQGIIHLNTEKVLNDVQTKFRYFQLALYQFAYASFVEILLLGNYEPEYLKGISGRIRDYALEYREFYSEAYALVEKYISASAQSRILSGVSAVSKFAGDKIAKSKLAEKVRVDDKLIESGQKLGTLSDDIIKDTMTQFTVNKDCEVLSFAERIDVINGIYNEPLHIAFDSENLYLHTS